MADLPSGTVTFLFTDIEGSTKLWERHPEANGKARAARHDAILRAAIEAPAAMSSRSSATPSASPSHGSDAIAAALAAQRALPSRSIWRGRRSVCAWACTPAPPKCAMVTIPAA